MYVIGLTGGIASGKSSVAKLFAAQGIEIIDADLIAREVAKPETVAYKEIIDYFGNEVVNADLSLNRSVIRKIIFSNPSKRQWLEELLHPLIRQKMYQRAKAATSPYCIMVIPLLVETLPNEILDRILVIDVDEQTQIERIQARDNATEDDARKILQSQVSRQERLNAADDIIENTASLDVLSQKVLVLHEKYLKLSQ